MLKLAGPSAPARAKLTYLMLDTRLIAREFLRAVRGSRSQIAFSRRTGFRSNVAAEWESGRRVPSASVAFRAGAKVGLDIPAAMRRFWPPAAGAVVGLEPAQLAGWLQTLTKRQTMTALAQQASLSRHQVARFLSGSTEPRLFQFFALVEAATARLSDFVAECVDIEKVSSLSDAHRRARLSRQLAFHEPWTSALLAAVECLQGRDPDAARRAISSALGLSTNEVERYVGLLLGAGIVAETADGYSLGQSLLIDTGATSDAARQLSAHWATVGAERAASPRPHDAFSFNVFSISRTDLQQLAKMQHEHFQKIRALIARSAPETVAVMNLQLFEFEL